MDRMIYLNYDLLRQKYLEAQYRYDVALSEREKLFAKTQPKSVQYDGGPGAGGGEINLFDDYLIEKERRQTDERLAEARQLMNDRKEMLRIKEQELRSSRDLHDKVYRLRYIEKRNIRWIAANTGYSESQVYRILASINKRCEEMRVDPMYNYNKQK